MSALFAAGALRLAGVVPRALGWRVADFWAATPAEIALVLAPPASPAAPLTRGEMHRLMERESDG